MTHAFTIHAVMIFVLRRFYAQLSRPLGEGVTTTSSAGAGAAGAGSASVAAAGIAAPGAAAAAGTAKLGIDDGALHGCCFVAGL